MTSNNFNAYYHVSSGTKRRDRSNLSRRDFLGVVSAIGAGAFLSGHSIGCLGRRESRPHRYSPSLPTGYLFRLPEGAQRGLRHESMEPGERSGRYGQGGHSHCLFVPHHSGIHVRRNQRGKKSLARLQRGGRETGRGSSRALRKFRHDSAHGHRGRPPRSRVCARYFESGRHLSLFQLWRRMAGSRDFRARL